EVAQSVDFHESVGKVITLILFGIVAIGVANTVLMSVMERLREFGVMMAVGTSSKQVFRIIIYEGLILGLLGFAIGLAIGYALVSYFGSVGLALTRQDQSVQLMQGVARAIYPHLSVDRMLYISTAVLTVIVTASLYPAWKIARMVPLHAMQGVTLGSKSPLPAASAHAASISRFLLSTLAMRNLTRHPLRTLLTMIAITFGLGAFVFVGSIANGFYTQIVANATGMVTGDAQIQHKDFKNDMKPTLSLPDGMQLLDKLQHTASVSGASPRVQVTAMITSPAKSLPIMLIGVNPDMERQVTFLDKSVKEGSYLQQGHDKEIVIGRKLAELLHVRRGERVVVMAQDVHGNLTSEAFVVAGMFYTGSHGFDDVMAHVTLPVAQNMLGMGNRITNIALHMQGKEEQLAPALQQIAAMIPPGDIKLMAWQELVPAVAQMNVIFKRSLTILLAIVLLMVSVVIMNTVLMSVMERTREFGTMLALGSRPGFIVRLVQLESGIIGVLGTLSGLAFGVLLTLIHMNGINMKMHGASIPGVTNIVYPKLSMLVLLVPGVLLPILALLAALYPALRASRLEPVRAIRHG
ncbi:MAG: ABC transporter permease, partial [Burkholderiaceae bacterium]